MLPNRSASRKPCSDATKRIKPEYSELESVNEKHTTATTAYIDPQKPSFREWESETDLIKPNGGTSEQVIETQEALMIDEQEFIDLSKSSVFIYEAQ